MLSGFVAWIVVTAHFIGASVGCVGQDQVSQAVVLLPSALRNLFIADPCGGVACPTVYQATPACVHDQSASPLLLVTVHGTWSSTEEFGKNRYTTSTWHLRAAVRHLACMCRRPVILYSFAWNGALCPDARTHAGTTLARALVAIRLLHQPWACWVIGHSHGCNVIAQAAQTLIQGQHLPIDVGIFVASPAIEDDRISGLDQPLGICRLYVFYGAADVTGVLGSCEVQATTEQLLGRWFHWQNNVIFARLRAGLRHLNHVDIKKVVFAYLPQLMLACDAAGPFRDLVIDVPYHAAQEGIPDTDMQSDGVMAALRNDSLINDAIWNNTPTKNKAIMARAVGGYVSHCFWDRHHVDIGQQPDTCSYLACAPFGELWTMVSDLWDTRRRTQEDLPAREIDPNDTKCFFASHMLAVVL